MLYIQEKEDHMSFSLKADTGPHTHTMVNTNLVMHIQESEVVYQYIELELLKVNL